VQEPHVADDVHDAAVHEHACEGIAERFEIVTD
jgi:hypothetical protein